MSEEVGISKSLAHGVLLKNSWDNSAAAEALKNNDYIRNTFNLDSIQAGKVKAALALQETEFLCGCCYIDCDVATESVMMPDCGHMLCTDCFPMYAQSKVTEASGIYASCPDKTCNLIVPAETF